MTPSERAVYLAHRQEWQATIGDPTPLGWMTVAAYALTALLAGLAAWRARGAGQRGEAAIWALFACALAFLAINKQIDLQSFVTIIGRDLAVAQGWFQHRRTVQLGFVIAVGLTGIASLVWLLRRTRDYDRWLRLALGGMCFVAAFVIIRAASFNHIDRFIAAYLLGVRWNWIMELGGIAVTAYAAWRYRPGAAA